MTRFCIHDVSEYDECPACEALDVHGERPVYVGWASFGDGEALRVTHDPFGHRPYLHNSIALADAMWSERLPEPQEPER